MNNQIEKILDLMRKLEEQNIQPEEIKVGIEEWIDIMKDNRFMGMSLPSVTKEMTMFGCKFVRVYDKNYMSVIGRRR